jgi:hypothetical protein
MLQLGNLSCRILVEHTGHRFPGRLEMKTDVTRASEPVPHAPLIEARSRGDLGEILQYVITCHIQQFPAPTSCSICQGYSAANLLTRDEAGQWGIQGEISHVAAEIRLH